MTMDNVVSYLYRPLRSLVTLAQTAGFPHVTTEHGFWIGRDNYTLQLAKFADLVASQENEDIQDLIMTYMSPSPERFHLLSLIRARHPK